MKKIFLFLVLISIFTLSCKNKKEEEKQEIPKDTAKITEPFIPSLPEGQDSSYITDTADYGQNVKQDTNFNLQQILSKYLNAMGMAKFRKIQTKIMYGKTYAGGRVVTFKNIYKRPDKSYAFVDYGDKKLYQGYNGEKGWRLYTPESDVPLYVYDDQLKAIKDQSEFDDILVTYKNKGYKLVPFGTAQFEGKKVYRLKMINEGMSETYFFIDARDYKLLKTLTKITYINNEGDYETIY